MKNKPYAVRGDKRQGFRIAVPTETGVKKGDQYDCTFMRNLEIGMIIPAGSLVYVPHVDDNAGTGGSDKKKVKK